MSALMGRSAEDPCAEAFAVYLKQYCGVSDPTWISGEAPDRTLRCNGREYAVEITCMLESIPLGDDTAQKRTSFEAFHKKIGKRIERKAKKAGILNGTYSICFTQSLINHKTLVKEAEIICLRFIESTKDLNVDEMSNVDIRSADFNLLWIVKHNTRRSAIAVAPPIIMFWDGDCLQEAKRLLKERINAKAATMSSDKRPKILLLWDSTILLDLDHFKCAAADMMPIPPFAAVYLVQGIERTIPIWSTVSEWEQAKDCITTGLS
jgi:hypothetical protein